MRTAVEACPLDVGQQLRALVLDRPGDVRLHKPPSVHCSGAYRLLDDILSEGVTDASALARVRVIVVMSSVV